MKGIVLQFTKVILRKPGGMNLMKISPIKKTKKMFRKSEMVIVYKVWL